MMRVFGFRTVPQKRDLSTKLLQKVLRRTVELRAMKVKQEARLTDMLEQIRDLWQKLKVRKRQALG